MQKTDFDFDKTEREFFVVLNNANQERFAMRMRTLLNVQIIKKQCKLHPNQNS